MTSAVASTIDVEQDNFNPRVVDAQASSEFEDEKVGFNDGQSLGQENPEKVWQPADA